MFKFYLVFTLFFLTTALSFSQNSRAKDSIYMVTTAKRMLNTYNEAYLTKAVNRLKVLVKNPLVIPKDPIEYAKKLYKRSFYIKTYYGNAYYNTLFNDLKKKGETSDNSKLQFWIQLLTVEKIMKDDFDHLKISDFEILSTLIQPGSLEEGLYYNFLSNVFIYLKNDAIAMNYSNAAELIYDNIGVSKSYYVHLYEFRYFSAFYNYEYQNFVKNNELIIKIDDDHDLLIDTGLYFYFFHILLEKFNKKLSKQIKDRFDYIESITSFAINNDLSIYRESEIINSIIIAKDAKMFSKYMLKYKEGTWEYNYYHYSFYKETEQWEKALPYLKKIELSIKDGINIDEIQENYNEIIEANTKLKDTNGIITYQQKKILFNEKLDSLTKAKSDFQIDFIKQIRALKVAKNKTTNYFWVILACLLITLALVLLTVKKLCKQKKLFNDQVEYLQSIIKKKVNENTVKETTKWQKIYNQILEDFCSGEFLNKNYTKAMLAKNINSNDKYISQAIKEVRQMSYSAFVVDLKIKVLKNQIESNIHMNKYKPEVLAKTVNLDVRTLNKYFKEHYKISFNDYLATV